MPQPVELAAFVHAELTRRANPKRAVTMAAYMKTAQAFYGVPAPEVHAIAKEARKRFVPAGAAAYRRNVLALWRLPNREARYAAIEYARQPAFLVPDSMPLLERMIREGAWWDFVDSIAANLVGPILLHHRAAVRPMLDRWIAGGDLWIRRSAILSQLRHKRETDAKLLFRYCLKCAAEREFFIRKAIGWALREYSKTDADAIRVFLEQHRETLSPLSCREAAKRLTPPTRPRA